MSREEDAEKKMAHRAEYDLMSQLSHPNIMEAKAFFENEFTGETHMVMSHFEGVELFDVLASGRSFSEAEA